MIIRRFEVYPLSYHCTSSSLVRRESHFLLDASPPFLLFSCPFPALLFLALCLFPFSLSWPFLLVFLVNQLLLQVFSFPAKFTLARLASVFDLLDSILLSPSTQGILAGMGSSDSLFLFSLLAFTPAW